MPLVVAHLAEQRRVGGQKDFIRILPQTGHISGFSERSAKIVSPGSAVVGRKFADENFRAFAVIAVVTVHIFIQPPWSRTSYCRASMGPRARARGNSRTDPR